MALAAGTVSGNPVQVLAASRKGEPLATRLADQVARMPLFLVCNKRSENLGLSYL
jgi:hypothetical protein